MLVHRAGHKSCSRESQGINAKSFSNGTFRPHSAPLKTNPLFWYTPGSSGLNQFILQKAKLNIFFQTIVFCCSTAKMGFTGKGATKDDDKSETCQISRPLGHIIFTSPQEKVLSNFILMNHLEPVVEVGSSLTRSHNHLKSKGIKMG